VIVPSGPDADVPPLAQPTTPNTMPAATAVAAIRIADFFIEALLVSPKGAELI
jgi:hypothetical protein